MISLTPSYPPAKEGQHTLFPDRETKFIVNPSLMRLIRTECEKKDQAKAAEYLIRRQNILFDPINLQVS